MITRILGHTVARCAHPQQQNSALPLYSNQPLRCGALNGSHPLNKRAQNITKSLTLRGMYVSFRVLINLVLIHVRHLLGQGLKRELLFSPLNDRTHLSTLIIPCNFSLYNIHLLGCYHHETFLINVVKIKGKRASQLSRLGTARILPRDGRHRQFSKGGRRRICSKPTFKDRRIFFKKVLIFGILPSFFDFELRKKSSGQKFASVCPLCSASTGNTSIWIY